MSLILTIFIIKRKGKNKPEKCFLEESSILLLELVCVCVFIFFFCVFIDLFVEVKGTLEALRNPRNHKINYKALSIIGSAATLFFDTQVRSIAARVHSIADAIEPSFCALECKAALTPLLGRSSAGTLEPRCSAIDRTASLVPILPFMLQFPESLHFAQKPIKRHKTQKGSKIAQTNKTMGLTNIN